MKKTVAVLGATGSIGKSAIDVIRYCAAYFEPVLFSAHTSLDALRPLLQEFPGAKFALNNGINGAAIDGADALVGRLYQGKDACLRALEELRPAIVVNGISGSAGLLSSLKAVELGCTLALANKESVVMAWKLLKDTAARTGAAIVPVDSECSAIFNLIARHGLENVDRVILTASGGPFRETPAAELERVTVEKALRHPTWKMGPKITLDSATLANKGLELMQISQITGVDTRRIDVSVHPQSIVHSMISAIDGSVYAALSQPDMRLPLHQALHFPSVAQSPWGRMSFDTRSAAALCLSFEKPDMEKFPLLRLAYQAAEYGGFYPLCYNAANETAAERFIKGEVSFTGIPKIVAAVLEKDWQASEEAARRLDVILEADAGARAFAGALKC